MSDPYADLLNAARFATRNWSSLNGQALIPWEYIHDLRDAVHAADPGPRQQPEPSPIPEHARFKYAKPGSDAAEQLCATGWYAEWDVAVEGHFDHVEVRFIDQHQQPEPDPDAADAKGGGDDG